VRRVRFATLAARDVLHELLYSERTFGSRTEATLRETFDRAWVRIAKAPARAGRVVGPGRFRYLMRHERLVVLYRWDGGKNEDPVVAAVLSGRRNLTERSISAYFRRTRL